MLRVCWSVQVVVVMVVVGAVVGQVGVGGIRGGLRRRALTPPFTTTATAEEELLGGEGSGLVVPDLAKVDSALLKQSQADKFLSLWYIYVLDNPVQTSST